MSKVKVRTSPSLALIKYWGKQDPGENIPATSSLAVTLDRLYTTTTLAPGKEDRVILGGKKIQSPRHSLFFEKVRQMSGKVIHFHVETENNFPTAAGLASSSSGFAALALGCARVVGLDLSPGELSALARYGSASAARALWEGFTALPAGAKEARPLEKKDFWPDLRILILVVRDREKEFHSRGAMESCRLSSPFYTSWVEDSRNIFKEASGALKARDLEKLGNLMGLSYKRMFASMLGADPPILYWLPESIALIHHCAGLRRQGIGVWETMDAGPQVKLFYLARDEEAVIRGLENFPVEMIPSRPGEGPAVLEEER